MNPLLKYGIVFGVAAVSIVGSYLAGVNAGETKEALEWREKQVDLSAEIDGLRIQLREQVNDHQNQVRAIEAEYIAEDNQRNEDQEMLISALRNGNIQLRKQFKKVAVCDRVPTNTAGPVTDNAAGGKGLSSSDAEFLIRFAGRCDRVVDKLTAAQAYIESIK